MPCTAKKFEAQRPEFATGDVRDVDAVLTTQELARLIRSAGIVFNELEEESFDAPFGFATGAGVIYGASGGVATAVVREANFMLTGQRITDVPLADVPDLPGVRASDLQIDGHHVRLAVVSGLGNARQLVAAMDRGDVAYDIVEVMACAGGCAGGGGQPLPNASPERQARARGLRGADRRQQVRVAQDNMLIKELYRERLERPNSETAHHLLHTTYGHRKRIAEAEEPAAGVTPAVAVKVCVGTSCYLHGARDVLRRFSEEVERNGLEEQVELGAAFCLEHCDRGPNVVINGREHHGVSADEVPELLFKALGRAKK